MTVSLDHVGSGLAEITLDAVRLCVFVCLWVLYSARKSNRL